MTHLEGNDVQTGRQFGLRNRSCVTNLLSFYSRVVDVLRERDGWVDCVYLEPHRHLKW